MKCSTAQALTHPYADDELDANRRAEVEEHFDACPTCALLLEKLQELRLGMRTLAPHYTASARLKERVLNDLREGGKSGYRGGARGQTQPWKAWAIAASILLAVAVGWDIELVRSQRADRAGMAREVVSSHVRSLMGTHLLDVPSSDQHTVKPWFSGKLDFSPDVKDLTADGFPLIGGRIEYFDNKPVAALVYKRRAHILNLFTRPSSSNTTKQAQLRENGYNVIAWTNAGMIYWAVSDLNEGELKQFVRLYQK